ncbi:MAG: L-histidine N(alpha)-methyltransferase [Gammaproteobacteria bacterium]|jgi:dimethylhistidine N-methyltransferase|nr:L-histidine N(alpha)-methyltransferase [Gammaproteobacteria bacterium]
MDIVDLRDAADAGAVTDAHESFALDVLLGLCSAPKHLAAKYFYDARGSQLFLRITQQREYYLTHTEAAILQACSAELARMVEGDPITIVELGPGDGSKSRLVIDAFLSEGRTVDYHGIDISPRALDQLAQNLPRHPRLRLHGIVAEYFTGLRHAGADPDRKMLVLFLGSNIGNLDRQQNQVFLRRLWQHMENDDHVLIGFDLKKDVAMLTRAYNDDAGYTRAFNLNVLDRINRELGGNFDLDGFQHFGVYNPVLGAMESYLLSNREQEVYISDLQRHFRFASHEPLHLEYSFKFLEEDISFLGNRIGFHIERNFADERRWFVDSLWTVRKDAHGN